MKIKLSPQVLKIKLNSKPEEKKETPKKQIGAKTKAIQKEYEA